MDERRLRIAVIGTSWWSEGFYLPSLRSHPRADVLALCGRNRARAEALAARFGIPAVWTDATALFRAGELDAVIIAIPDDTHHALANAALDAGLHTLCEKPLALDVGQAAGMLAKARASGRNHMVLFTNRWYPHIRHLRALLASGGIGRVRHAEFVHHSNFGLRPGYAWRFDAARANGVLADLGAHWIDLARWLVGEIDSVEARLQASVPRRDPDGNPIRAANDIAALQLGFAGGASGQIALSAATPLPPGMALHRIMLAGERGSLLFTARWGEGDPVLRIEGALDGDPTWREWPIPEALWAGVADRNPGSVFRVQSAGPRQFVDDCLAGIASTPDFADGLAAQRVIDAALAADRLGLRMTLAPLP